MQCAICLSNPDQPITMNCCKNKFCKLCIGQWMKIRSVCPLCCAQTGSEKINNLRKKISGETFDDSSLMIEVEVKQIKERIKFIQHRVANKRQQFNSLKSGLPSALMKYFEMQLQQIQEFEQFMDEQILLNHRGSTFEYMQLIVEAILNLQNCLDTNSMGFNQEQLQQEEIQEENDEQEEQDQNSYEQYEIDIQKKANSKYSKHRNISNNQGKNKVIK